jgi:hypothetical protein
MRLTAIVITGSLLAALAATPAVADDEARDRRDVRQDRREIRGDNREIRQDRRELRGDRRELRRDVKAGRTDEAKGDLAAIGASSVRTVPIAATTCATSARIAASSAATDHAGRPRACARRARLQRRAHAAPAVPRLHAEWEEWDRGPLGSR